MRRRVTKCTNLLWPERDGDLSEFMRWLTVTHTQRWHAHRHTTGSGHLFQGRFKSFPVQTDEHLLTVCRYVERNLSLRCLYSDLWVASREIAGANC